MRPLTAFFLPLLFAASASGQVTEHRGEAWMGYIGTVRVADKWSLWQDYHWVPDAFGVVRYGVVYKPSPRVQLAGGHAWVWTATSFTTQLVRGERRPWGQVLAQAPLGRHFAGQVRFRYDARYRERISEGRVLDEEYGFNHRLRFMARIRANLRTLPNGDLLHLNLMDEYLHNAGRDIANGMDQNRSYVLLGYTHKQYTLLGGYHVRMIPQAAGGMRYNHGLTLWFLHTIDVRHRFKRSVEPEPPLPHGG